MVHQNGKPGNPDDLKIVKHGQQFRATITIALSADDDKDIIDKLNGLPKEARQASVKRAVRVGMKLKALDAPEQTQVLAQLEEIVQGIRWLISYFQPFHKYLEDKFSAIGTLSVSSPFAGKVRTEEKASQETLKRRRANLLADEEEY